MAISPCQRYLTWRTVRQGEDACQIFLTWCRGAVCRDVDPQRDRLADGLRRFLGGVEVAQEAALAAERCDAREELLQSIEVRDAFEWR